jgi:arylsulfatase A-like enzyme
MKSAWLLPLLATSACLLQAQPAAGPTRPNIVFILADDFGWSDLGCYGSTFYETPHLDGLAAAGVRFTQAYAASNVCSPTRASILTGRYPARVGITDWLPGRKSRPEDRLLPPALPNHLALAETTLAEALRAAGYRTAMIGKWHLGEERAHFPEAQGFDVNIGGSGKGHPPSYFSPHRLPNLTDGPPGEHLDDRLTREAEAFMSRAAADRQPFLLYLAHYAVHTPLQGKPELVAKYQAKLASHDMPGPEIAQHPQDGATRAVQSHPIYAAMMESLDTSVGRLVAKLDELGLRENTIIIFTSDNGGLSTSEGSPTSNLPLRAGKGWAYEGGVREPLLVAWAGRIPAGQVTDQVITSPDFFPTLLELAGLPLQPTAHVDGRSFASVLRAPDTHLPERPIFWHYPHYSNQRGRPHGAIRTGRWKLIEWFETGGVELFDLLADPGETTDQSGREPAIAADLQKQLQAWREQCGALMPTPQTPPATAASAP